MALSDYLNFGDTTGKIMDISSAYERGEVKNAVENADEQIEQAQANAAKRAKIADLKNKISNLKNQKAQLERKREQLVKERENLRDEDIVQMAKVKGIKDEDIKSYLDARITQRNADLSKAQSALIGSSNDIEAQKAKNAKILELKKDLEEAEGEITSLNVDIATGTREVAAKAEARKRVKEAQYKRDKDEYNELTGNEWQGAPEGYKAAESTGTVAAEKPEGFDSWSESDKAEYNANAADPDKQNKIIAKNNDERDRKLREEKKRKDQLESVRADLEAIGVKEKADIAKLLYDKKLQNDPIKKPIIDRLKAFIKNDKQYKTIAALGELWGK